MGPPGERRELRRTARVRRPPRPAPPVVPGRPLRRAGVGAGTGPRPRRDRGRGPRAAPPVEGGRTETAPGSPQGSRRLDIPRLKLSSGGFRAVAPGDLFVVEGAVGEAAVKDADEPVGEGSK